ncbi:MAG: hypothetical protein K8J31_17280 [Anaerolineae bacterium]|nr:hypothetical protein [Anaerolineae bacterium]
MCLPQSTLNDPATRSKLETKGDIVMMRSGAVLVLETNTLRLQARVVDLEYGQGPLPPNSFLQKLTIEVAVWQKAAVAAPMGVGAAPVLPAEKARPLDAQFDRPSAMPAPTRPATPAVPVAPAYGGPPPRTSPPTAPMVPPRQAPPPPPEDDPFGGTGDFTPIG